jgi:hypothetical protein
VTWVTQFAQRVTLRAETLYMWWGLQRVAKDERCQNGLRGAELRSRHPIAALDKSGGLISASRCQPIFLSARGPQQDRAKPC